MESKRRAGAKERELWQGFEFGEEVYTSREKENRLHASLGRRHTGQQYISRPYFVPGVFKRAVLCTRRLFEGRISLV